MDVTGSGKPEAEWLNSDAIHASQIRYTEALRFLPFAAAFLTCALFRARF